MVHKHLSKLIMLVDDEPESLSLLKSILCSEGYQDVVAFNSSSDAKRFFDQNEVATAVLDLRMPGVSGQELLEHISARSPKVPAIIVTAENHVKTAIECMRLNAIDYLVKPILVPRLLAGVAAGLEMHAMDCRLHAPAENISDFPLPHVPSIVTCNRLMHDQLRYLDVVAKFHQPILITGETGVGKELFARAVHTLSERRGQFVSVNIAGLDDLMLSDTLFGHRKGAYTGALQDRDGLIKKAAMGTLFLDEIGDLSPMSQIKLLRLIQENEYYPLGSDNELPNQARIVLATNCDLRPLINDGSFRKDLYYRLCMHQIAIPPLRERTEDIRLLLDHFIAEATATSGRQSITYCKELVELLANHNFPGNIRELQAVVSDAIVRSPAGCLSTEVVRSLLARENPASRSHSAPCSQAGAATVTDFPTLKQAETELISRALEITGGNQGRAAKLLGITRQALNNRLRRGLSL